MNIPEEERKKGTQSFFEEIIAENFSNLETELHIQVHKARRAPNYLNLQRPPRPIILKLSKINVKNTILKVARGKKKEW